MNRPDSAVSKFSGLQPVLNNEDIALARQGIVYISLLWQMRIRVDNGRMQ